MLINLHYKRPMNQTTTELYRLSLLKACHSPLFLNCEQSLFFVRSLFFFSERASSGEAARREKRGRQPEKKKDRLPAQPEPMKYALASQRKNTIGWCVKRWQQTVNNRNHWQVDDGWSTAGMFVTFPENWHSKSRAKWSIGSTNLQSWCYCNFADWFWKKPDFSTVLWGKACFEPKYIHFSGCPSKPSIRGDQCKMGLTGMTGLHNSYGSWHLYICHFLFSLSTFYVASVFVL